MNIPTINYLEPFTSINHYLRALQITNLSFSQVEKNYYHVAQIIKTLLDIKTPIEDIVKFVKLVEFQPSYYG